MYRRPIVTLIGNGDRITLDGVGSEFTLKPGMTGTGIAPREYTFSDLARGGALLRHRRNRSIEIMIPIDVFHGYGQDSYALIEDSRRRLEALCDGLVEIQIETKDGFRSAFGWLKDGLEGDFAKSAVNLYRMNLALVFTCPDPWWYGDERVLSQRVDVGRKPFLTGSQSVQLRRNLFWDGGSEYPGSGSWVVHGVRDTEVKKSGSASRRLDISPGKFLYAIASGFVDGAVHSFGFEAKATPNVSHIQVQVGTGEGMVRTEVFPVGEDWSRIVIGSGIAVTSVLVLLIRPGIQSGGQFQEATTGQLWADEGICEAATTVGPFFDGDTLGSAGKSFAWEGAPGNSVSVETLNASPRAIPFFPVILAGSTVQGAFEFNIGGDAPVWPTWEVDGPGTDLLIQNDVTGERIFVEGDFSEMVTIDSRNQSVSSSSIADGSLWERVSLDSVLFQLKPGPQRIRIQMVNARPNSVVRLRYRETWRAAH